MKDSTELPTSLSPLRQALVIVDILFKLLLITAMSGGVTVTYVYQGF